MNLKLGKFKKVAEDEHSATLKHPEGHHFVIAKKLLSKPHQEELSNLPMEKMADGGNVQAPPSLGVTSPNDFQSGFTPVNVGQASQDYTPEQDPSYSSDAVNPQQFPDAQAPAQPSNATTPNAAPNVEKAPDQAPSVQDDPYGSQAYSNLYTQGVNEQKAGIENVAKAEGAQAAAQAPILDKAADQMTNLVKGYQDHFQTLDGERQAFQNDIQNQHIDPNHYLASMGTGQHIATSIGLILGGMGAGLTGGPNQALEFLNKQIDRDVNAQTQELGKKENLLSANMRQFGNLRDATDMTKVMQSDIIKNQLAAAAARTQNPLAQARAQQAIGQLDAQTAPIMSKLAIRRTLGQGLGQQTAAQGPAINIDPASKIRLMGMSDIINPEQQAAALKENNTAQELVKARDNAFETFDKVNQLNTVGNRIAHLGFTPATVEADRDNAAVGLARDEAGRVNEFEFNAAKNAFPAPGDSASTLAAKKRNLSNIVQKKMNFSTLNGLGIDPSQNGKYDNFGTLRKQFQLQPPVIRGR